MAGIATWCGEVGLVGFRNSGDSLELEVLALGSQLPYGLFHLTKLHAAVQHFLHQLPERRIALRQHRSVAGSAGPIGPQIVDLFHSESTETSLAIGLYLDDSLLSCLGSCLGSHLHLISLHRFFASSVTKFR